MRILPTFNPSEVEQLEKYLKQELTLGSGTNSLREKLLVVQKTTGRRPKELDELVDFPQGMYFVWKYFIDLSDSRSTGVSSVNPIAYSEMLAYFQLHQIDTLEWEIDVIKRLDKILMEHYAQKAQAEAEARNKSNKKK